jgi:predicted NBD/HSP70 family sugar kinase
MFTLKEKNHRRVLNLIRNTSMISGAQLSKILGLHSSTIHYILQHLQSQNLIKINSTGTSTSSGGKPPTLWEINGEIAQILGIEMISNTLRISCTDFAGNTTTKIEYKIQAQGKDYIHEMIKCMQSFIDTYNIKNKLLGIGIAVSGLIDKNGKHIIYSRLINIEQYPLADEISSIFKCPVVLSNDANTGALGFLWQKKENEIKKNFIYITSNMNVNNLGLGIIINSRLHTGGQGIAGELIETLPSLVQLMGEGTFKLGINHPIISIYNREETICLADIVKELEHNCAISAYIMEKFTTSFVQLLVRLSAIFDPEAFIIGGDITELKLVLDKYIKPLLLKNYNQYFPSNLIAPEILFAESGKYSVSQGATSLIMQLYLDEYID